LPKELLTFVINHRHKAVPILLWKKLKNLVFGEFSKLKLFHKRKNGHFSRKANSPLNKTWDSLGNDGIVIGSNIFENLDSSKQITRFVYRSELLQEIRNDAG
jgi:hypothetical protein